MMASSSGYNNGRGDAQSISHKLRATDLPSKRLLGKGLASIAYETELGGLRYARKDFMGVPSDIFQEEANALVHLEHDNIVKTHGWTVDKMSCSLVEEYVEDDVLDLLQRMKKSKGIVGGTSLELEIEVILQIARAMAYLHGNRIRHGDLKPCNIFATQVKETGKNSLLVKVADFGLIETKRKSVPFASCGVRKLDMVRWKAPEYFEKAFSHVSKDNEDTSESDSSSNEVCTLDTIDVNIDGPQFHACDTYSFALTCYQILTGKQPYASWNWKALGAKIVQDGLRPKLRACPDSLANLLEQCWNKDRTKRPTFTNICRMLEDIQLSMLQSIDHQDPIMGVLDGSSSDVIATQKLAIASSSKDFDIENKSHDRMDSSLGSLMRTSHLKPSEDVRMGDPLVTHVAVGFVVNALLEGVIKNANSAFKYKDECRELADKLGKIEPYVTKFGQSPSNSKHAECVEWLTQFRDILVRAEVLTNDCLHDLGLGKTKRMLKFWRWEGLPSRLTRINSEVDKAMADAANLFMLDVVASSNTGVFLGFGKQAIPPLIVGVEVHFNKLKASILKSYERMDEASTFGLHGSGGAGKTLLAQMLANDRDIKETYGEDSIIWITAGLDASVGDLYEHIGKCSNLDSGDLERLKCLHNKEEHRMFLKEALSKKKVLLILDDAWVREDDHHDMMYWLDVAKAPGSAMLITTRSEAILQRAHAKTNAVLSLNDDDSWKLFSFHAFVDEATSLKRIPRKLARAICKECKGLPLALKVIGSAMMDKMSVGEWESALSNLQQSTSKLDPNVDGGLFGRLQLSYKELKNDAAKVCFLYFAAFPKDHKIEVELLINIWVGEELFGMNLSTKEAKRKAYDHLRVLVKRSLIDWNQEEKYVHIHGILWDLALYIIDNAELGECAYECLFHSENASPPIPARERVVGLKRMSFMDCGISQWREDLQIACGEVKVCILQNIMGAPFDFFNNMVNLRVLDLSRNSCIPEGQLLSITNFAHLTKLNLSHCHSISKLSKSMGNLKRLTELDLSECQSLMELPESIGNLKHLVELDLSTCRSLTTLPESFGSLKCLTELNLRYCVSLTQLPKSMGNLKRLTELDLFECQSLMELPESICSLKHLTKLNLQCCKSLRWLPEHIDNLNCLTMLELSTCRSLKGLPKSIGNLKCLIVVDLSACGSMTRLPESIGNLKYLKILYLKECGSLKGLPKSIGNLNCLEVLDLSKCVSLRRLPESIGNLKCLEVLDLSNCGSLTGLPMSIANLKYVRMLYD